MSSGPSGDKARDVRAMFSRIAGRYDLMNALMTFGLDGRWRRLTARAALSSFPRRGGATPHLPASSPAGGEEELSGARFDPPAGSAGDPPAPADGLPDRDLDEHDEAAPRNREPSPPAGEGRVRGEPEQQRKPEGAATGQAFPPHLPASSPAGGEEESSGAQSATVHAPEPSPREGEGRVRAEPGQGSTAESTPAAASPITVRGEPEQQGEPELRTAAPLVLDAGTGTADLALAARRAGAAAVVAVDFSEMMLRRARVKLARTPAGNAVRLVAADALRLPFDDATFDGAVNGFVLRNVAGLDLFFAELLRVLKPGGRLACLELTHAPRWIAPLFRPYFEGIVPLLGRIVGGDAAAYRYLPASVRPFPDAAALAAIIRAVGFVDVRYRRVGLGVVAIHTAGKPPGPPPGLSEGDASTGR
jgi:demethylmenaquinone methyltransferase / 2-methoxy-6-polyprenyl-1,4-benzoquinol methylase